MKSKILIAAAILCCTYSISYSQKKLAQDIYQIPYFTFGKGLGIVSPDSLFMMNIRFRMQNRIGYLTNSGTDWRHNEIEGRVRRLRLRFDGFLYNPKFTYVLQLSFSRGDIDFEDSNFPNIIRDAMVIYNFNKHFSMGLGQTKLPGNRQRVISSGDLQLPDRSIVNSRFNVDRDFGVQTYYRNQISGFHYVLRGALSTGEGRNFNNDQDGLAYTGRVELLPLGEFKNNGDYFEGDLLRGPKPKLSIGISFSNNENSRRSGGQLGKTLYQPRDIETTMADLLYKHNGLAISVELLKRHSPNPITIDPTNPSREQHVFAGHGENYQTSYLFKNNQEIVARFSNVRPAYAIQTLEPQTTQYTLGTTRYLRGHRVKLQGEITYEKSEWLQVVTGKSDSDYVLFRFQIEAGI